MRKIRKDSAWVAAAFLLLCAISAYRQVCLRVYPDDVRRLLPVYPVYLLLLGGWWYAVRSRVVRGNMRLFIMAEQLLMLLSVTARPVLENVFSHDIYLLRVSGYFICLPMVLIPLLGLYASFGLGRAEDYRMNRRWYYLLMPAVILIALMLTNESHNFVFLAPENGEPGLAYHPGTGLYLILMWSLSLIAARILVIFRKSREAKSHSRLSWLPIVSASSIVVFSGYYLVLSYAVEYELIEYMVLMFFLEAMVWESCIFTGMVPVNTNYEEVFDRSTVAMQILSPEGYSRLRSSAAAELSPDMFARLREQGTLRTGEGMELKIHEIGGGYAVWQTDISKTLAVIDRLQRSAEKLEQDAELLSQELKIQSDEAAVREQNLIYNRLTDEVGEQLTLMRGLLEKSGRTEDDSALFKKICLIGTYVKRRCNLRLIEQSEGTISTRELELCFGELSGCLRRMGIGAEINLSHDASFSPEFAIYTLDVFEYLLELARFEPLSIEAELRAGMFQMRVYSNNMPAYRQEHKRISREPYRLDWQSGEESCQVTVWEGGSDNAGL